jgi:PAS domain S-box-containing protein
MLGAPQVDGHDMGRFDMTADTLGVCGHDHLVQFYASDEFLVETVAAFLVPALRNGDAAIVAATAAHRQAFDSALAHAGIDVDAAVREGRYLTYEASDLLSRFMVHGTPDATCFRDTIGAVMDCVSGDGRALRVYGEMVALLYDDGDADSAVALEDFWNDLADSHAFELLCAYPMRSFDDEVDTAAFKHICAQHSAVIPCEGYSASAGPVEQSRSVAELQQEMAMLARGNELSAQNKSILDAAGDGIFGADTSGTFTFANPAAVRMTGYSPEDFAGRNLHALLHRTAAVVGAPALAGPQASLHHGDHDVFWRKDGTSFPVEYSTSPIVADGERPTGAVVVFRDIGDRLAADRVKDEFTSVVSHELRTPLTSIRASLGLLESGVLGTLPDEGQRMLQIAVRNTDRLVRLIGDILDLERIDSPAMRLHTTSCDAADIVGCAIDAVLPTAVEADVRIETDARPAAFAGDSDRLIQALTNLIANAVKFSPPGSTVRVTAERCDAEMRFEVSDHGRGIALHELDTIFERFTQVETADACQRRGTGLGLSICRGIVELHGGRIWARSEPGEGSTFTFVIPGRRSGDQRHTPAASTPHGRLVPVRDDVRSAA